jgi:hypothetical protein
MSWLDYAAIREQIPIRRVLELLDWQPVLRRGPQWRGPCPLSCCLSFRSQATRCFSVHLSRDLFRCFHCNGYGNQLDLWAAATEQPLHPATLDLCNRLGITPIQLKTRNREIDADQPHIDQLRGRSKRESGTR